MSKREIANCHDCGVEPGQFHKRGCDTERCCLCGYQAIACHCVYEVNGIDYNSLETEHPTIWENGPTEEMDAKYLKEAERYGGRLPWTGFWPGVEACREFDLWCFWQDGRGWIKCTKDHPEATEDLNALMGGWVARWDKSKRAWVAT